MASSTIRHLSWARSDAAAGWRATLFTHTSYLEHLHALGQAAPLLFDLAIGFRHECVKIDVLHCVDLGVAAHVIANILVLLVLRRAVLGGSSYDEKVRNLHVHLNKWYRRRREQSRVQGKITVERLRTKGA